MYNLRPHIPTNLLPKLSPALTHRPHFVYILEIKTDTTILYKVGLSSKIRNRIRQLKPRDSKAIITLIASTAVSNCDHAGIYESYLLEKYKEYRYTGEHILTSGNSELFTTNILLEIQSGR